jgi:hypothetical protein
MTKLTIASRFGRSLLSRCELAPSRTFQSGLSGKSEAPESLLEAVEHGAGAPLGHAVHTPACL